MVSGSEILRWLRDSRSPNTERSCSKRSVISRPFFSPASVMTTKCAERYSCHLSLSSEDAKGASNKQTTTVRRDRHSVRLVGTDREYRRMRVPPRPRSLKCYHATEKARQAARRSTAPSAGAESLRAVSAPTAPWPNRHSSIQRDLHWRRVYSTAERIHDGRCSPVR